MDELRTSIRPSRAEHDRSAAASLRAPRDSALEEAVGRSLALAFERLDQTAAATGEGGREGTRTEALRAGRGPEPRRPSARAASDAPLHADIPPEPFADGPADAIPARALTVASETALRAVAAAVDRRDPRGAVAQDAPFRDEAPAGAGAWLPARGREGVDGTKRPVRSRLLWGAAAGAATPDREPDPTDLAGRGPSRAVADPGRSRPAETPRRRPAAPPDAARAVPSRTTLGTAPADDPVVPPSRTPLGTPLADGRAGPPSRTPLGRAFADDRAVPTRTPLGTASADDRDSPPRRTPLDESLADDGAGPPSRPGLHTAPASDRLARAPAGRDGRTLEEVATDLLRPMLQEWLDANLAAIVERQVAEEIARLARPR